MEKKLAERLREFRENYVEIVLNLCWIYAAKSGNHAINIGKKKLLIGFIDEIWKKGRKIDYMLILTDWRI